MSGTTTSGPVGTSEAPLPPPQRSRRGCWTCKRRHKKCDETRPTCKRCMRANIECEGFETRLTWGPCLKRSRKDGVLINPVRPQSLSRKTFHQRQQVEGSASFMPQNPTVHEPNISDNPNIPKRIVESLKYRYECSSPIRVHEETTERLLDEFSKTGYLTLTGKSGDGGLLKSDVLPLRKTSRSLCYTLAAYRATLSEEDRQLVPAYLQLGLSGYMEDLESSSGLLNNATLATGILLCSVSISGLYTWTPLLGGLATVLQQRKLLSNAPHSALADHFLEVIGLLDVPHFTVNRISKSLKIWSSYIARRDLNGIQETSGLPYSLLNLICDLDEPHSEQKLRDWRGEPCHDLIHVHLWEAFRLAAMLHFRALQCFKQPASGHANDSIADEPYIQMKILASCQAVLESRSDSFLGVQPLGAALLYPLFIVCLLSEEDTLVRSSSTEMFSVLVKSWESFKNGLVWDIIIEVWERSSKRPHVPRLALAEEFAQELNVEVYLY